MKPICLLLLILMSGCGQSEAPQWIEVDEPYDSVLAKLNSVKAESLEGRVGILCSPDRCEFYVLPDGTCLELWVHTSDDNRSESISGLTLGEAGVGYGDKVTWSKQQKTDFARYDLSQDLLSNQKRVSAR